MKATLTFVGGNIIEYMMCVPQFNEKELFSYTEYENALIMHIFTSVFSFIKLWVCSLVFNLIPSLDGYWKGCKIKIEWGWIDHPEFEDNIEEPEFFKNRKI